MLCPTLSAILLASALSISVEAVSVYNYASANCGDALMGGCEDLPERRCCRFRDSFSTGSGLEFYSGTRSIRWNALQDCDVGTWFYPSDEPRSPCGSERNSITGSTVTTCVAQGGNPQSQDGAMWFHVLNYGTGKMKCPPAGIVQALPNPNFKVGTLDPGRKVSGIQGIPFPSGWGAVAKRSIAGRTTHEVPAEEEIDGSDPSNKCEGVVYADTYVWGENDSVYILKGSKEVHDALDYYSKDKASESKQSYVDFIKSLGAIFYSDWRDSKELGQSVNGTQTGQSVNGTQPEKQCTLEKRQMFAEVKAAPAPPGAGDKPIAVKNTWN